MNDIDVPHVIEVEEFLLEMALEEEDFEEAAIIRDRIKQLKGE